jgi:hypothetical protein
VTADFSQPIAGEKSSSIPAFRNGHNLILVRTIGNSFAVAQCPSFRFTGVLPATKSLLALRN